MAGQRVTSEEIRARLARRLIQIGSPSYREMEPKLGYTHQTIQRYVSGTTEAIPAPFLARFAAAYPTDLIWLITGMGTPEVSASVPSAERAIGEIERILHRYHAEAGSRA